MFKSFLQSYLRILILFHKCKKIIRSGQKFSKPTQPPLIPLKDNEKSISFTFFCTHIHIDIFIQIHYNTTSRAKSSVFYIDLVFFDKLS